MTSRASDALPLCVDLDGTLVRSDLLLEAALRLIRQRPWLLVLLPLWLLRGGRAGLKREVARRVRLDPATLPYNEDLLAYLRRARAAGRELILATASDQRLARAVADHLGLFSRIEGSDGRVNLAGRAKAARLTELLGPRFDYVGDHRRDLPIWQSAHAALLVDHGRGLARALRARGIRLVAVFGRPAGLLDRLRLWLRAMRLYQWSKNALVFVPLLTSYHLTDVPAVARALLAFLSFGLMASAAYLLNDLLDLEADRRHPRKSRRPFAAGLLPLWQGLLAVPLLAGTSLILGATLSSAFLLSLLAYLATTTAYSLYLKRQPALDVLTLAGLYSLRLVAGAAAIAVPVSDWLLAFSMFFFTSLALLKRHSELQALARSASGNEAPGRGYRREDLPLVVALGASSAMTAILVLVLYLREQTALGLYREPLWMWLLCPVVAHWLLRVWLLGQRGEMDEDPVVFAMRDRYSRLAAACMVVSAWLAH